MGLAVAVAAAALLSPAAAADFDDDEGTIACSLSWRRRPEWSKRAQTTWSAHSFLGCFPALIFFFFCASSSWCGHVVCSEGAGGHQSGADRPERSSWRLGRHDRRRPVWLGHGHLQPGPSLRAVRSLSLFLARFCASMMVDPHRNQVKSWFFDVFFFGLFAGL